MKNKFFSHYAKLNYPTLTPFILCTVRKEKICCFTKETFIETNQIQNQRLPGRNHVQNLNRGQLAQDSNVTISFSPIYMFSCGRQGCKT